jgi:hypothetical protein
MKQSYNKKKKQNKYIFKKGKKLEKKTEKHFNN